MMMVVSPAMASSGDRADAAAVVGVIERAALACASRQRGGSWMMSELERVVFRRPVRVGDRLNVQSTIVNAGPGHCDVSVRVFTTRGDGLSERVLCTVLVGLLEVEPDRWHPAPLTPDERPFGIVAAKTVMAARNDRALLEGFFFAGCI